MKSNKGFLEDVGPHRRLTQDQLESTKRVLDIITIYAVTNTSDPGELISIAHTVMRRLLNYYPLDRSCHTCDFSESFDQCSFHNEKIPDDFLEKGCEHHQTDGVPF